jgi:hypothetical protein
MTFTLRGEDAPRQAGPLRDAERHGDRAGPFVGAGASPGRLDGWWRAVLVSRDQQPPTSLRFPSSGDDTRSGPGDGVPTAISRTSASRPQSTGSLAILTSRAHAVEPGASTGRPRTFTIHRQDPTSPTYSVWSG